VGKVHGANAVDRMTVARSYDEDCPHQKEKSRRSEIYFLA
jgi:hypothetical protein